MANYNRLDFNKLILPSIYDEASILLGFFLASSLSLIYLYGTKEQIIDVALRSYALDPLTSFLEAHNLTEVSNNIITFCLFAFVGICSYFAVYIIVNNYLLVRNEAMLDNFHHPTANWHHWGRFFSVEAAKGMIMTLCIMGTVVLVAPLCLRLYADFGRLINNRPYTGLTSLLTHIVLVLLSVNAVVVLGKLYRRLSV